LSPLINFVVIELTLVKVAIAFFNKANQETEFEINFKLKTKKSGTKRTSSPAIAGKGKTTGNLVSTFFEEKT